MCTQHFLCFGIFYLFLFFWYCCYMTSIVQPVCTFLSCTFLLILIFKSTVYCHAHFYILLFRSYFLLISFSLYLYLCIFPLCLYSIIFALSMERTWLSFHCWLYILYIIVYVTNKNLESWITFYFFSVSEISFHTKKHVHKAQTRNLWAKTTMMNHEEY